MIEITNIIAPSPEQIKANVKCNYGYKCTSIFLERV